MAAIVSSQRTFLSRSHSPSCSLAEGLLKEPPNPGWDESTITRLKRNPWLCPYRSLLWYLHDCLTGSPWLWPPGLPTGTNLSGACSSHPASLQASVMFLCTALPPVCMRLAFHNRLWGKASIVSNERASSPRNEKTQLHQHTHLHKPTWDLWGSGLKFI